MESQNPDNGQIHMNMEFGMYLYELGKINAFKNYLEIGTWKGNGSTLCVIEGIKKRLELCPTEEHFINFYSFESNEKFHIEALTRHSDKKYPYLHLIYGRLHNNGLMSREEIEKHPYYNNIVTHYKLWYEQDYVDYIRSPFIDPALLPNNIDVIILDGGEFSGYADWLVLKDKNIKVVCLDDTGVMKNERVYKELKNNSDWILLREGNDRHGWAIFIHKSQLAAKPQ